MVPHVASSLALLLCATLAEAQSQWRLVVPGGDLYGRRQAGMVFHAATGKILFFGGLGADGTRGDTFEWNGVAWSQRTTTLAPPARNALAMAYDSARQRTVLFGGQNGAAVLADTWEWDGNAWQQRTPANQPPGRFGASIAFDASRGRIVLFGGQSVGSTYLADTWEWDGSNWQQRVPANTPPARRGGALAWDAARGNAVLFGGFHPQLYELSDTWTWNGSDWTRQSLATVPHVRLAHALGYDSARQRVLLVGGWGGSAGALSDTWEWDGATWTLQQPVTALSPHADHALCYDAARGRSVLMGGGSNNDQWEWDGNDWKPRAVFQKPTMNSPITCYDSQRKRLVAYGFSSQQTWETWEWDGFAWTSTSPSVMPPGRSSAALAYDSKRGRTMLFGGSPGSFVLYNDTWAWDGTTWTQLLPSSSPPGRTSHTMAYDKARDRIVLAGGGPNDTWEWDGTTWTQRYPPTVPVLLSRFATYDERLGKVVLVAQKNFYPPAAPELWSWDGTTWSQIPTQGPVLDFVGPATFDAGRRLTVVIGTVSQARQAWEWDGSTWAKGAPPPQSGGLELTYESHLSRCCIVNGSDVWEYFTSGGAAASSYGQGCGGLAGVPSLHSWNGQLPLLGFGYSLELSLLPPGATTIVTLGGSSTFWNGAPLPIDLTPIHMPGCKLLASADVAVPLLNLSGAALLSLVLPSTPALTGQSFYSQGFVYDSGANPFGLGTSNGLESRLGMR